jgi:RecA-family ATPase
MIKRENPVLAVFDSLIRIHTQQENEARGMAKVMARLRQIADLGVTVLVLHHLNKGSGSKKTKVRGSTDIMGGPDAVFLLTNHKTHNVLESLKNRYMPFEPAKLRFFIDKKKIWAHFIGKAEKAKTDQEEILEVLNKAPKAGVEKIFEELKARKRNLGKNALRKLLAEMATAGEIKEERGHSGKKIYSK